MALSIFENKEVIPTVSDLQKVLGDTFFLWEELKHYVLKQKPDAMEEWNYAGKGFGWNFRIKDKKRVLIYLIPCNQTFKLALVYGEKASKEALSSSVSDEIKAVINSAKVYLEGRGFRIDIHKDSLLTELFTLIDCKLRN